MNTYEKIKNLRLKNGLSQTDLASLTGYTNRSTITRIENGEIDLPLSKVAIFADALNVDVSYLMGWEKDIPNIIHFNRARKIPILGQIACGSPTWAEENYDGYFIADQTIRADFALKCKGDSMVDAEIYDGDLVFLRKTPDVENGRIAAVLIESEATLKKIVKANDVIILQPCNNDYEPMIVTDDTNVLILGEAVGVYHPYRNK